MILTQYCLNKDITILERWSVLGVRKGEWGEGGKERDIWGWMCWGDKGKLNYGLLY